MRSLLPLALLAGCSDYQLGGTKDPAPPPTDTGSPAHSAPRTTTTPPPPPEPTGHTGPGLTCADVPLPALSWRGSPPFAQQADPADGAGRPFWDPAADTSAYLAVSTPDTSVPVGRDRAYVATFDLPALPPNLSLDLQSDDGIWVWLNGTFVGHWGGDWQQEGCVNEDASCLVTTEVDPVDVTGLLVPGANTLAARISNPVQSAYFEILPLCLE